MVHYTAAVVAGLDYSPSAFVAVPVPDHTASAVVAHSPADTAASSVADTAHPAVGYPNTFAEPVIPTAGVEGAAEDTVAHIEAAAVPIRIVVGPGPALAGIAEFEEMLRACDTGVFVETRLASASAG